MENGRYFLPEATPVFLESALHTVLVGILILVGVLVAVLVLGTVLILILVLVLIIHVFCPP